MESSSNIKLRFNGVDIFRVNFNATDPFDDEDLNVEIHPRVFYPTGQLQDFKILMDVKVTCKEYFSLSLTAVGDFEFTTPMDNEEERKAFVNVNSVAIMFPYVRAFISTFTSNIGRASSTIVIPARFFKGDIDEFRPEMTNELP